MKNLILPSIELQKGDQVEVLSVRFANHAHMVGQRGLIVRYVKSRIRAVLEVAHV